MIQIAKRLGLIVVVMVSIVMPYASSAIPETRNLMLEPTGHEPSRLLLFYAAFVGVTFSMLLVFGR